jgi:hypothetical protein
MNTQKTFGNKFLKIIFLFALFCFLYISIGSPISSSIESILISRAQVHSHANSLALTPLITDKYYERGEYIGFDERGEISRKGNFVTIDPRITALRQFLIDYNSPMYPYAETFVTEADKYGLDWRLVVAIAGVESAFGNLIPYQSNNAWGWRGGPDLSFSNFDDWGHGVEVVTRRLALGYGVDMTPFEIEPIYCPPCGQNPQSLWANGVIKFKRQIDIYLEGF